MRWVQTGVLRGGYKHMVADLCGEGEVFYEVQVALCGEGQVFYEVLTDRWK